MKKNNAISLARRTLVGSGLGLVAHWAMPAFAATPSPSAATRRTLRLAVVPQLTPIEMSRYWSPVVDALGQRGIPCELVVYPSIAAFEAEFLSGKADLVFLNPYHMVMAHRAHKYEPLLHDARALEGVLLVSADGPIQHIEQLRGQRISFPAPNAFAASLYIRSVLDTQHHLPFEAHYAQNHRNAIRQVLLGDSQAAGVVKTTFEKEPPDVQQKLRVIYTTPPLAPHPLAAHPRVSRPVRAAITEVLLGLAAAAETQTIMAGIQMPSPVLTSYAKDYAPLERLKVDKYVVLE